MTWDPQQYRRFADERSQPFFDLLDLVEPGSMRSAVDLGCGSGELTELAAQRFDIVDMVGVDNSPSMLAAAEGHTRPGLRFEHGDIGAWTGEPVQDLLIANASLQWVPDHEGTLRRWMAALAPGGQLAVQVPANAHRPTHTVAAELAAEEPYRSAFGATGPPPDPVARNVLEPEAYAELLYGLGARRQHVRLVVYPHVLPSADDAVEWVKGTTLTRFAALPPDLHQAFLDEYRRRLVARLGETRPLFFPFRRILFTAAV